MAWNHNPNPPTGPGIGGPANGPGKGPGSGPAAPFTADSPTRGDPTLDNHDQDEQAYRKRRQAENRKLREEMMAVLVAVAKDTKQPGMTRGMMADKVLDRIDGKPTQKTELNANIRRSVEELSDDELLALAGAGESPGGAGEEGGGAE